MMSGHESTVAVKAKRKGKRLRLVVFTQGEFRNLYSNLVERFVGYQFDHKPTREEEAATRRWLQNTLPEGMRTPGHAFYHLEDAVCGLRVGFVWLCFRQGDSSRDCFLMDFEIFSPFRRSGYTAAAEAFFEVCRDVGARRVVAQIRTDNRGTLHLAERLGFEIKKVIAVKEL